jgi:hypothetical protein
MEIAFRSKSARMEKNPAQHDALFKIPVDFSFGSSLSVTLVSQLAPIDHHFFLDFIFH